MLHSAIKRPLAPAPSPHHSLTQPPPGLSALETERLPVVFTDILATSERSYDTFFEKSDRMHVATVDFTPGGPVSVRTAPAVPSAPAAPVRELRGVEELSFVSGSFQASDLIPGLAPLVDDGRVEKVGIGGRALGSNAQNLAPIGALGAFGGSVDLAISAVKLSVVGSAFDYANTSLGGGIVTIEGRCQPSYLEISMAMTQLPMTIFHVCRQLRHGHLKPRLFMPRC